MKRALLAIALVASVSACAKTTIQPMAQDTFKVATNAAPACGPNGARNVAFKTAAVEVLRRGGDRFVIINANDQYDGWSGMHNQGLVVKLVAPNDPQFANALSAKQQLGPNWAQLINEGTPNTCT